MRRLMSVITAILITTTATPHGYACDMEYSYKHEGRDGKTRRIYSSVYGRPAIFYRSKMNVNTDGSPRSYHPNDPRGNEYALNNIGNAIGSIYSRYGGRKENCYPRKGECYNKFIRYFEEARDSEYDRRAKWVTTPGVIPWSYNARLRRHTPCVIPEGKNEGYFVSPVAYPLRKGNLCDHTRYMDSTIINSNVLPSDTGWRSQDVVTDGFDLVVVFTENGGVQFAVNGDRGPSDKIGEVSVALAARMLGRDPGAVKNYQEVKDLALPSASYLIFPTVDIKRQVGPNFKQEDIDRIGKRVFERWGGVDEIKRCAERLRE